MSVQAGSNRLAASAAIAALAIASVAEAQPANPPRPTAPATTPPTTATQASNAAGVLFDKGRQYAAAGKHAEACAAFEQSQKLDPQLGTLYNMAICHAQLGKLATAWAEFHDLAQRDANKVRRGKAAAQEAALAPRLPRLLIKLTPEVADATVTSNGVDVGGLLGVESPVDLGDYVIVASAPGYPESRTTARVTDEGATVTVAIKLKKLTGKLQDLPPNDTGMWSHQNAVGPEALKAVAADDVPAPSNQRTIGIATVAGGGALLAGGIVFGVLASGKWSDAKAACGGGLDCPDQAALARAQSATHDARVRGDVSTALVVTGAAAAGVGAYLWLRAPSADRMSARLVPQASPAAAGLAVEGSF